jgi:CheY-like chemotaxis protein
MTLRMQHRILVVDDWPEVRELVARLFTGAGFEVSEASNLEEARVMIAAAPPEIVITDYFLPDQSDEFLHWLKRRYPKIPVIVLSASPHEAEQSMPEADVILGKPISLAVLVQMVLRFVDLVEAERLCGGIPN